MNIYLINYNLGTFEIQRLNFSLITSSLSPQELKVIVNRFGLVDGVLRTQKEVAIFLGISSQRVSQIEYKATKKIKIARCLENLFEKK